MEALVTSSKSDVISPLELAQKVEFLEQKVREMDESIRYAGSLQQSILPNERIFQNVFKEAFVFFQPKDVVSGDFYWIYQHGNEVYFAVGDCTGHGVPGALVNIAGNSILRQLIRTEGLSDPAEILHMLDMEIVGLFNENLTVGTTRDGMEMAFCKFNLATGQGEFASAGRPLVLIREKHLVEFPKGPSIGYFDGPKEFETQHFSLIPGDTFYLFSDGYTDQFGGDNVKKFNRRRFRQLLQSVHAVPMELQKREVMLAFDQWKGNNEQIDDVCVIGIRV